MNCPEKEGIALCVDKGIRYLHEHQLHNGEFYSYMAPDPEMKEWCIPENNISAFQIGECLLSLKTRFTNAHLEEVLEKIRSFLDFNQQWGSVWNYYTRFHTLYELMPFDIDDTVCASAFMLKMGGFQPHNIPLILSNRNKEGLFYTWFLLRKNVLYGSKYYFWACAKELKNPIKTFLFFKKFNMARSNVGVAVNANVLYYLGDIPEMKPVIAYLNRTIMEEKERKNDRYYHNPLVIYYVVSRNYHKGIKDLEPSKPLIVERVLAMAKPDGRIGDAALETAMAVSILLNFSCDLPQIKAASAYIRTAQMANGAWPRHIIWVSGGKADVGWGSEELTTAFCLEALGKFADRYCNN